MDKIFHSTFDFFSHALPGFCMALACFILDGSLNAPQEYIAIIKSLKIESIIALLGFGYILGFGLFPLGRFLYKQIGLKIWKMKIENNVDIFISDKYALIRELSPSNFKYVEIWNMYCAMAHNLAIASLLIFIFTIVKIIFLAPSNLVFWWGLAIGALIFFFLLLHRAVVFSIWAAHDLNASVKRLELEKRSKNLNQNTDNK
jgi:hypothetical protein